MSITATANPSSGPTPGTYTVEISGAQGAVDLYAAPSPPNPDPMPDYEITPRSDGNFDVEIKDVVAPGTELFFKADDAQSNTDTAVYEST